MLEDLKEEVFKANLLLVTEGLVRLTWGNVSGIDRDKSLFVIKPSGVSYDDLKPEDLVVLASQHAVGCKGVGGRPYAGAPSML